MAEQESERKPLIAFRVDEERKAEWEDYLEHSHFGSMSQLIRVAVENEVNGGDNTGSSQSTAESQKIGELEDKIDRMSGHMRDMQQSMQALSRAVSTPANLNTSISGENPADENTMYEHLPESPQSGETVEEISERIGLPASRVEIELERLREQTDGIVDKQNGRWHKNV